MGYILHLGSIAIGTCSYLLAIWLFGVISREEIRYMRELIGTD